MEQKKFDQAIAELDAWIQETYNISYSLEVRNFLTSGIPDFHNTERTVQPARCTL